MRVLVVDDERNIRTTLRMCLEGLGCEVREAATPEAALAALAQGPADLAFVDLRLGTASGLELLPRLLAEAPTLDVVLITAYATFDTAVEAVKRGARDYLPKPFTPAQIRHLVEQGPGPPRAQLAARRPGGAARAVGARGHPGDGLADDARGPRARHPGGGLGRGGAAARRERDRQGGARAGAARAERAAPPALRHRQLPDPLRGAAGQRALRPRARGLHRRGARPAGPGRGGRGRHALPRRDGGDEPRRCRPSCCASSRSKQFERVGESRTRRADVRVVAATNRDLEKDGGRGPLPRGPALPAQRRRGEAAAAARAARGHPAAGAGASWPSSRARPSGRPPELSPATEKVLLAYPWPGNVRELRNAMERALIVWPAEVLEPQAFPERIAAATGSVVDAGRAAHAGGGGARAHPAGDGERPHAGRGRAHPRHRRVHAVAQAQEVRGDELRRHGLNPQPGPEHPQRSAQRSARRREWETCTRQGSVHSGKSRRNPARSRQGEASTTPGSSRHRR